MTNLVPIGARSSSSLRHFPASCWPPCRRRLLPPRQGRQARRGRAGNIEQRTALRSDCTVTRSTGRVTGAALGQGGGGRSGGGGGGGGGAGEGAA